MTSDNFDIRFLEETAPVFEQYLLSKTLHYPLSSGGNQLDLCPGQLLLCMARSKALREDLSLYGGIDDLQTRWHSAWNAKLVQDFDVHLSAWRIFLDELVENPVGQSSVFSQQVSQRVMLTLIIDTHCPISESGLLNLEINDQLLKHYFSPGPFLWGDKFITIFPSYKFWYLYGNIRND